MVAASLFSNANASSSGHAKAPGSSFPAMAPLNPSAPQFQQPGALFSHERDVESGGGLLKESRILVLLLLGNSPSYINLDIVQSPNRVPHCLQRNAARLYLTARICFVEQTACPTLFLPSIRTCTDLLRL
eukprot:scaffold69197_cov21-Tisochrysis_lutea.AAC.1